MYLIWLFSCVLLVAVSGNAVPKDEEDLPDLKWPKKYTVKADKMSLTAGWVEDMVYWRTTLNSRVDYNKGAVKKYSAKPRRKSAFRYGVKYMIHPETPDEETIIFVCKRTNGTIFSRIGLEHILPDEDSFERVGTEYLNENKVEKFSYNTVDQSTDVRQTLWASYIHATKSWIPVKYEKIEFDTWLDLLNKHDVWNFYNYETDFDDDVFNVDKYECEDTKQPDEMVKLHKHPADKHIRNVDPENKDHVNHVFNAFKKNHKKIYKDESEHEMRKKIFHDRLRLVLENNRKNTGYKLAINKFADRTPEEMKRYTGLIQQSHRESDTHPFPYTKSEVEDLANNLPKNFDLRDLGIITPVRDQEECGSCWTFGTTAAVEGALARKNGGRLYRLANQALIDCAWGFGVSGCDGGFDIAAYRWMMEYGLPTEEEYGPYANREGFCHIENMTRTYPILGFTNVTPFSAKALKVALVNHGPLSVSIHVTDSLSLYKGGIFYDIECTPTSLNHEVTVVGYGERDGDEYWIIKNSWGQTWGVDGYLHISTRDNNCGVTTEPTYAIF
ncbi:cathepsin L-like proteinase [Epargyreus clarus]|uniref:cathepsin L-like proteinase n=1 Tax=Epargyreus clarus TaxID=520877 RepID=UPI003C30DE52